jgi:predicted PurR-regulated permease PerM
MPEEPVRDAQGWWSREHVLILALGLATLIALYVCYLIVEPFIPAVAIATAVAVATSGPHRWLRKRLGSKSAAAAVSVALAACLIVIPLSLLITHLVRQIIGLQELQAAGGLPDLRGALPPVLSRALDWAESNLDVQAQLIRLGQALASQAGNLLAGSVSLVTQLVIMLFVLFFLYRDGDRGLSALRNLTPLSKDEADRMLSRIEDTILATVNGSLVVAFAQAVLAGVMYMALGVPASMIWAAATFIVALVPVFGTVLVWGPVALYLLISGSWIKAIILAGWGMLAVGTIDNILYPHLVGGRLRLHTVPTFFAIVGGVGLFGPAGLILGPVALAITIGLLEVWRWRTAGGRTAEQAVKQPSGKLPLEIAPVE